MIVVVECVMSIGMHEREKRMDWCMKSDYEVE